MAILADLTSKSPEELIAMIHAMDAAKSTQRLTLKINTKGGLSIYGMGRFPVSLYASQWRRILAEVGTIQAFLKAHASELTEKPSA
jgi:hypothetical protein